jgi:hypothetical protein
MPENKSLRGCDRCAIKPCGKSDIEQRHCFIRDLLAGNHRTEHWVKKRKESQK